MSLHRLDISRRPLGACRLVLLALDDDALKFLEDWELLVGRVNLGITLLLASQEADLLEPLKLALDVPRIFLY
jgi:hypothetical protein